MIVDQLIKKLQKLPKGKSVLCQVVGSGTNTGAWSMGFDFHDIPGSSFIQLEVKHPDLKELPPIDFGSGKSYPESTGNEASER